MEKDNRRLVENYIKHYNNMNIQSMLALFADNAEFESVSNTEGIIKTSNKNQLSELASASLEFFEKRQQMPLSWVISDNQVAVEIDYWCKLAKDLPNGKKAGDEMKLRGASFFEIRDGLIRKLTDYM
ncbi:MAG TPA: nuclear transport factor 2 family protein [Methanotrichaceae archaeon]|nr:nuclear transport factor 2 family protein [Methanotrichaceae archaeon]